MLRSGDRSLVSSFAPTALHSARMSGTPNGGAGRFARLAQLVKDHPALAVASALGSLGTFAAGTAGVVGLFVNGGDAGGGTTSVPDAPSYEYAVVSDRTNQISLEAPTVWARVEGNGWHPRNLPPIRPGTRVGPGLNATTNLESWHLDLRTPGVFVGASEVVPRWYSPKELVGEFAFSNCDTTAAGPYASEVLEGEEVTLTCAGARWQLVAGTPTAFPEYTVYVQAKLITTADDEAYEHMLETLELDLRGS